MSLIIMAAAGLLGLLGGALLLLALGFAPYWQSLDPAEFSRLFGANAPIIGAAMMPLGFSAAGLTWLSTVLAVWKKLPSRIWLVAASICALCMIMVFPLYFAGANAALIAGEMSGAEITAELTRWEKMHWLRTIAAIVGCFCAINAVRNSGG